MKRNILNVIPFCLTLVFLAYAQGSWCELKYTNMLPSGQCLDIGVLNGSTVTLPSNTIRIDNSGISLCKKSPQAEQADIVFIVDQSGSMGLRTAFVSVSGDTNYYENTTGCTSATTSGTITIQTYASDGSTTKVTRPLPRLVNNAGCTAFSGDPFRARATAVEQAVDYIASNAPGSTVGYAPFATTITSAQSQRPLVLTAANITALKAKILIDSAGSTNYNRPMDSAGRWLTNPTLAPNAKHAIVFISDGRPNPTDSNGIKFLKPGIPVYSIFLSKLATPDTAILKRISDTTGGKFYRVSGSNPDSLIRKVKSILDLILQEYTPVNTIVSKTSPAPAVSDTADAANFLLQPDGSWLIPLKQVLPLNANAANQINITSIFKRTQSMLDSTASVNFTLSTTGPAQSTSGTIDGNFSVVCHEGAVGIAGPARASPAFAFDKTRREATFTLLRREHVEITLFDSRGATVEVLLDDFRMPGAYEVGLSPRRFPPGIYFLEFRTGDLKEIIKISMGIASNAHSSRGR